jgi:hypothetical protein
MDDGIWEMKDVKINHSKNMQLNLNEFWWEISINNFVKNLC